MDEPVALAKIIWQDVSTGGSREHVLVEGATATIGRSQTNDICVPERHVSRRHAVINYRDGIFMLSDLGSANGTFVNDKPLDAPFPLAGGDVLRLFVPELRFEAGVTPEEEVSARTSGTLILPTLPGEKPYLVVTSGPQEGDEFPLLIETLTIGRMSTGATWEIQLKDRAVSRPHARLKLDAASAKWAIIDLGSANGTSVNGQAIHANVPFLLKDGDVLMMGASLLLFRIG